MTHRLSITRSEEIAVVNLREWMSSLGDRWGWVIERERGITSLSLVLRHLINFLIPFNRIDKGW